MCNFISYKSHYTLEKFKIQSKYENRKKERAFKSKQFLKSSGLIDKNRGKNYNDRNIIIEVKNEIFTKNGKKNR
jgi:hypothetical protein